MLKVEPEYDARYPQWLAQALELRLGEFVRSDFLWPFQELLPLLTDLKLDQPFIDENVEKVFKNKVGQCSLLEEDDERL